MILQYYTALDEPVWPPIAYLGNHMYNPVLHQYRASYRATPIDVVSGRIPRFPSLSSVGNGLAELP